MAGIGFVLRKLYRQDNLAGLVSACLHSTFASAGPWLFTVLALATISGIGNTLVPRDVLVHFRAILIYNFSFSLVLSGPVFMIATRFLADCLHRRDLGPVPGMFFGTLTLLWGVGALIAVPFYFFYINLPVTLAVSAVINFLLVSAVWLVGIFLSALRSYNRITFAFIVGMCAAVAAATSLATPYGTSGLLNGFSIGIAVILALLIAAVLGEYSYPIQQPFGFLSYFKKYWEIGLSGLVYNMAIWVDKWVMWFAPEATKLDNGLVMYPHYDSAMFIAFLAAVPSMAMFLFNTETHFFEHYRKYYQDIEAKATFAKIQKNHQAIRQSIYGSVGYFFVLQGSITIISLLMAPAIIDYVHGDYLQIGMLRYGLAGTFFQVLLLFLLVLLSYFDHRRGVLYIQLVFLATNALFTWGSLHLGFAYYGYGYFLACFLSFILACLVVTRHVAQLPYHTFITSNASLHPVPKPA